MFASRLPLGDVREFVSNYAAATIEELDALIDFSKYETAEVRAAGPPPPSPPPVRSPPAIRADIEPNEWHERYLRALMDFMHENRFKEVHLGPFIRWLQVQKTFELVSGNQQRRIFDELQAMGAVTVEERETGQGYPFSVAHLNWNDGLVQRLNGV